MLYASDKRLSRNFEKKSIDEILEIFVLLNAFHRDIVILISI